MSTLPLPTFHDPEKVPTIYVERAALIAEHADAYRAKHNIKPAAADTLRIGAFGIDAQIGFCSPGASLFVPGAVEDTQRTIEWIYRNLDRITSLHFSLDTHRVFQVFHPAWWIDASGKHPAPFTTITKSDLASGRFKAARPEHQAEAIEYVDRLDTSGKYVLTVWPYHALLGGISHALVPSLMEAALFHALVRDAQTHFETKGENELTENYSVLSPEVRELGGKNVGAFNDSFFASLLKLDRIYVFGQAKSHCVLSTLRDMQEQITRIDPKLLKKIYILEDATSPVPAPTPDLDFPRMANEAFAELSAAGMNLVKTTDAVLS